MKNRLKILFCSSEVAPFSKEGGLADVAGSLPQAIGDLGHEVDVMTPQYRGVRSVKRKISGNVTVRFIQNARYFKRSGIYGNAKGPYADNLERFAYFCLRVLEIMRTERIRPDIIHVHDWHTALIPIYLKTVLRLAPFHDNAPILFTIHNMAYQGNYPIKRFQRLVLSKKVLSDRGIRVWGQGNLLKGGMIYADQLSTVSKTYAHEIQNASQGCGLQKYVRRRKTQLTGILNGIDQDIWNPARDPHLKYRYTASRIRVRAGNKTALQKKCGLKVDAGTTLISVVSRLVEQKGFDLVIKGFHRMMSLGIQFVILGSGEARYRRFFESVRKRYRGQFSFCSSFNTPLASLIYGACDFFLMPSRFEPCGLGQLISLRYGALPIAHWTGGLKDTVVDYSRDSRKGNGIVFHSYNVSALLTAVRRAQRLYQKKALYERIQKHAMRRDYSWKTSAKNYVALYRKMMKGS